MNLSVADLEMMDRLLTVAHVVVIAVNVLAWIPKATRGLHRVVFSLTLASWFVCGYWKGWGYCFLTDFHWTIKKALGESDLPSSFIHWVVQRFFGIRWSGWVIDSCVLVVFIFLFGVFIWQTLQSCLQRKEQGSSVGP